MQMHDDHIPGRSQDDRKALDLARRALPGFDEKVKEIRRLYHGSERRQAYEVMERAHARLLDEGLTEGDIKRAVAALDAEAQAR
jgi:hypothetical protein